MQFCSIFEFSISLNLCFSHNVIFYKKFNLDSIYNTQLQSYDSLYARVSMATFKNVEVIVNQF
jgi:hypothetical protein